MISPVALTLLAGALGQPVQHHAHRREAEAAMDYVTLFQTYYVTAGADGVATTTSDAAPTTSEAPAPTTEAAAPTTSESPAPAPTTSETPSSSSEAPAPSTSSSSSSSTPASTSSSSSGSDSTPTDTAGSAGALGITYSPYSNQGGCKSSEQVASELGKLSGYSVIRLYGSDCNQVANVHSAKASNQKLFVGVFDVGNIDNELQSIHSQLNGDWSSVETVSIGNELVNNGEATVSQIKGYLDTGRSKLSSLGYDGPVVSVDTFIATINNPGLCELSDYMAVNAHAYFDGGVTADQAGSWAEEQIQRVWGACDGKKKVTIVETGWPSRGDSNGKAVCSEEAQKSAIDSLKKSIGNDAYIFTAYNDLWKQPGYLKSEQYWGIYGDSDS